MSPAPAATVEIPDAEVFDVEWDGKVYRYDVNAIDVNQAMVIKLHTGYNLRPWQESIREMDPKSMQAFMWVMKQQNGEPCNIGDLNFPIMKFLLAFGDAAEKAGAVPAASDPTTGVDTPVSTPTSALSDSSTSSTLPISAT